jgi:ELWxxDGT repeat protein
MKTKPVLSLFVTLLLTAYTCIAQDAMFKKPSQSMTPFGEKLPPPDMSKYQRRSFPGTVRAGTGNAFIRIKDLNANTIKKDPAAFKQLILQGRNIPASSPNVTARPAITTDDAVTEQSDFHLTKDINALSESFPADYSDLYFHQSFAILDGVVYFAADDGIHGDELWRSDGTAAGTYMVKDIEPGIAGSNLYNITALNGELYFSAFTSAYGWEPWISNGTKSGTQLLKDIVPGPSGSDASEFMSMGNTVYFAADAGTFIWGELWQTDGTAKGTKLVKDLGDRGQGGDGITQLTAVNNQLFFTFFSYGSFSWQLWRSDGTNKGTYRVAKSALFPNDPPAQLTANANQLYFSADEGSGRRLWVSDGTDAGTKQAPRANDIYIEADDFGINFPVMDNVLYAPGFTSTKGDALYKFDASNSDGLVKIKDLTTATEPDVIVPSQMAVVNHTLYFKVTNDNGGVHDELWSSGGEKTSTGIVTSFNPGEAINELYNGNGMLYFTKYDIVFGNELWQVSDTFFGKFPVIQSDVFSGATSSNPNFLTSYQGRVIFAATSKKGTELFITNPIGFGATLVKDINTTSTSSSYAGTSSVRITPVGPGVIFDAYENVHGDELYRSDGTDSGTRLINDILPGEFSSYPFLFSSKKNKAYFVANSTDSSFSIYGTNGTKSNLEKLIPDYSSYNYGLVDYQVSSKGFIFYVLFNFIDGTYELWRSDGTAGGNIKLSSAVYSSDFLNVTNDLAFFAAGDAAHGYELWESDGSIAGTKMVKDINPGAGSSEPGGLFVYKNEVYFGAFDGVNHAFWKSDGTKAGTVELKNIDPWWGFDVIQTKSFFCISNDTLYFSAINYSNGKGTELWKTDGTAKGTQVIKDINRPDDSIAVGPVDLTDVNGIVFFSADDGIHGRELWKTDGTAAGTKLVKDITPGPDGSALYSLVSYAGRLFFINNGVLWSSDGTANGTGPVNNAFIQGVDAANITVGKDQLFIGGYTQKYGTELYAGTVTETGNFAVTQVSGDDAVQTNMSFSAAVYPNPVVSNSVLELSGKVKNMSVSITDISGRKLWQVVNSDATIINLPLEKLAAGNYIVTVTNGMQSKTIKVVKQ